MDRGADPDRRDIPGLESVLVVAEPFDDDEVCVDLLTQSPPSETAVVSVTFEATPAERVAVWQREYGAPLPASATIVDGRSSVGTVAGGATDCAGGAVDVEVLPADAGLSEIGMAIARQLGQSDEAETTQLCVHSLSAVADRFRAEEVAEFVGLLNRFCDRHDVVAHHHVAPDINEELLSMLRPQYEMVAEETGDGWTVTSSESKPDEDESSPGSLWTTPSAASPTSLRYSFDSVWDLLSNPVRRTLLYHLRDAGPGTYDVTEVSEAVARRLDAIPVRETQSPAAVERVCIHVHLPKLADVGLIAYDHGARTVTYRYSPALEQIVDYVETLELG